MFPTYTFKVSFSLDHGYDEPTPAQIAEVASKVDTMTTLLFGDKVLASPNVEMSKDEELDFTVYAEVQATLSVNLTVTTECNDDCAHNAGCIAEGLIGDLGDYLKVSNENCGIELAGTVVNKITILHVEVDQSDSPQGENG